MADPFTIRLVLSFVTGFIWITLLTILAERFGTKIGGAIAGIPATMVVALLFIGITQSSEIASASTTVVPLVVGMNALFTVIYIFFARHTNLILSLAGSLAIWGILSFLLVLSNWSSFSWSIVGYIALVLISYYFLEKRFNIKSQGKRALKYTAFQFLLRAFIGGSLIFLAVLMAKIGGPLLGGIFASFPALTVALIIITRLHHEASYTEALLKNFIIGGTINVVIFVAAVRYLYPVLGLANGTIVSLAVSLVAFYLGYHLIIKKMI
ncbi:MAG: DUF3147 family protein [Candidatus Aenigmarchaeota archaeon]|nr:DUF3147 family protein [Candidatus Aenigmarchaeota archaeon]